MAENVTRTRLCACVWKLEKKVKFKKSEIGFDQLS